MFKQQPANSSQKLQRSAKGARGKAMFESEAVLNCFSMRLSGTV